MALNSVVCVRVYWVVKVLDEVILLFEGEVDKQGERHE